MAAGPWTWFDIATEKYAKGNLDLVSDTLKLILTNNTQVIDRTFSGTSTDCGYSDITGELSTANGYTAGGYVLTSQSITRSTRTNTWSAGNVTWTLTGDLTFKYGIIYDDTSANKDLIAFFDSDNSSSSAESTAPLSSVSLIIRLSSGVLVITSETP